MRPFSRGNFKTFILALILFVVLVLAKLTILTHNWKSGEEGGSLNPSKVVVAKLQHRTSLDQSGRQFVAALSFDEVSLSSLVSKPPAAKPAGKMHTISLATHCSSHKLIDIVSVVFNWKGPVSLALYYSDPAADLNHLLTILLYYSVCGMADLSATLISPSSIDISHLLDEATKLAMSIECAASPENSARRLLQNTTLFSNLYNQHQNYADVPYPNNFLRNAAVEMVRTEYVLVLDSDMEPSEDLLVTFDSFIKSSHTQGQLHSITDQSHKHMFAFVLPAFERQQSLLKTPIGRVQDQTGLGNFGTSRGSSEMERSYVSKKLDLSMSKALLLKEWSEGSARPFYAVACPQCQQPTNYAHWRNIQSSRVLSIGYEVHWVDAWEPFYIARREDIPVYDERFEQYGYNRISQVCEAYVKGFNFVVLDNAFVVHRGFKNKGNFHQRKEEELAANYQLYKAFRKEMVKKYPDSPRTCLRE